MIELVRGDRDKLEGKVLVYSIYEESYIAYYATTDAEDFKHVANITEKELSDYLAADDNVDSDKRSYFYLSLTKTPVNLESDVLSAGSYSEEMTCHEQIQIAIALYMNAYFDQNPVEKEHAELNPPQLRRYISIKYIGPLVEASAKAEIKKFNKIKKEFLDYTKESRFHPVAQELVKAIKSTGANQDLDLVDVYVRQIEAIHAEKYEEAQQLKLEIQQRTGQPRAQRI